MDVPRVATLFRAAGAEIAKAYVGQEELVEGVLIALFAGGSVLIEGVPGLGKTLLVKVLQKVVAGDAKRVQFTPDLMPSDLTGHSVYDMDERRFHFHRGPIFTNFLLADEINRSPAKTQAALLEVMQEQQVTVDGIRYPIERPFLVLATQNPLEHEGTYPLPESQIDRFLFKLLIDYPGTQAENAILQHYVAGRDPRDLESFGLRAVLGTEDVIEAQRAAGGVLVEPKVVEYITALVGRTRAWHNVAVGASPRASVGTLLAARTLAACRGRDFTTPDDVRRVLPWVLRHRLRLRPEAEIEGVSPDDVIAEILAGVEVPRA